MPQGEEGSLSKHALAALFDAHTLRVHHFAAIGFVERGGAVHAFARWRPEPPPRVVHVCLMCFPVLWLSGARPDCRSLQG